MRIIVSISENRTEQMTFMNIDAIFAKGHANYCLMRKQILFTFCCLLLHTFAFGQSKALSKADKLYKAKSYTEAAKFYEIALEEKTSLSVKTKLANCYRVNNRMETAEKLYAEITAEEKAKSKTYLYYGEALMSNGKYDEAKKWFTLYEKEEPDDEQARLMIEACDYVKSIIPYFPNVETEEFTHNSDADDSTPVMWGDKLVFSSDRSQGLSKKSGWTGRSFINLFYSNQTDTAFTEPKIFSGKLVASNKNIGNPTFVDSTRIFFTKNGVELSRRSVYNLSLFTAENAGGMRWKNIEILPFSSKEYNFMHPSVSADGKYLYFVSDKGGGEGGTDIWMSKRTKDGWSRTKNLGLNVNTAANEGYPFIDNGKLYFCSKGHPGYGGFDIFMTEQDENGEWKKPINLGSPINSPRDDISIFIDKKKKKGMFTSNRSGGDDDIYLFEILDGTRKEEKEPMTVSVVVKTEIYVKGEEVIEEEIQIEEEIAAFIKEEKTEKKKSVKKVKGPKVKKKKTVEAVQQEEVAATNLEEVIEVEAISITEEIASGTLEEPKKIEIKKEKSPKVKKEKKEKEKVAKKAEMLETQIEEEEEEEENSKEKQISFEPLIIPETPVGIETTTKESGKKVNLPDFYYLSEITKMVNNKAIQSGQTFRFEDVNYDFEVYQVTPEVAKQLDIIAVFLVTNEEVKAEIGAHTESKGNDKNNLILSRYRAQAAVAYLKKQGIDKSRLSYKGYGEQEILNHCVNDANCDTKEHSYNQRLEMKILEN
jgi:outer membrane protein OmpA-like peptidoglycan-associated protein/tetratricopeptide (TPR) repeat protein